ncbi:MAG TPA: hypothetical protein VIV58_22360 [Kofleriaceae bacterium]
MHGARDDVNVDDPPVAGEQAIVTVEVGVALARRVAFGDGASSVIGVDELGQRVDRVLFLRNTQERARFRRQRDDTAGDMPSEAARATEALRFFECVELRIAERPPVSEGNGSKRCE